MIVDPKRILWPTDFSELSLLGGRYAEAFRNVFHAELHVLHVILPPLNPEAGVVLPTEVPLAVADQDLLDAGRKRMDRLVAEQFAGDRAIAREVAFGNPWSTICEYAETKLIDLIVVATHGRTGLRHALIGSTAERIVRHAPCPVLTVKTPEKDFLVS
ncbi:MAG: universal stress protein [Phycisphaerae bacterium]